MHRRCRGGGGAAARALGVMCSIRLSASISDNDDSIWVPEITISDLDPFKNCLRSVCSAALHVHAS